MAKSDGVARRLGGETEAFHYGSYTLPDVVSAPYLLELANRPDILAGEQDYLGCLHTRYSLHAWWSFPGHGKASISKEFHRDLDDFQFCTMIVYLTDVEPSTSPHQFIRRSHRLELVEAAIAQAAERLQQAGIKYSLADFYGYAQGYGRDDLDRLLFSGCVDTICGPAGTAFIADTIGLYKGIPIPPIEGPRLMFWASYGLYRNTGNAGDRLEPLPPESVGPACRQVPAAPISTAASFRPVEVFSVA